VQTGVLHLDQGADGLRMAGVADADAPRTAVWARTAGGEVAAGLHSPARKGSQLSDGQVDGQPLGNGAEVQQQRLAQRDRAASPIAAHVAIGRAPGGVPAGGRPQAGAVVSVKAARFLAQADRRVKRPWAGAARQ